MSEKNRVEGKKILIVDDEPDVLETLEEVLSICDVEKAASFKEAKDKMDSKHFDLAILDIMGVEGYKLLELANKKNIIAVMLTAHALSPENIKKSFKEGAASYIPKDEMSNLINYLNDILEAKEKGKSTWWKWMVRFGNAYWEKRFGPEWQKDDKDFWKNFPYL
jgi:DNA-binding NtrC family response regulator